MHPVEQYWHAVKPVTDSEYRTACAYIREKFPDEVISRRHATIIGLPIYKMKKPCKNGHHSWRYVNGRGCIMCQRVNSDGKLAYHKRPKARHVDRVTRDLMRDAPELVISRDDAKTAGLAAYRLGERCGLCDNNTWRHIDTLACVECMPVTAPAAPGQDLAFEESFKLLRNTIGTFTVEQLKGIEKDLKMRNKKDPRHAPDFNRALRFVRRHIRERK